jgi:hypothetical protein
LVQISTTVFEPSTDALVAPSSLMLALMNSTAMPGRGYPYKYFQLALRAGSGAGESLGWLRSHRRQSYPNPTSGAVSIFKLTRQPAGILVA